MFYIILFVTNLRILCDDQTVTWAWMRNPINWTSGVEGNWDNSTNFSHAQPSPCSQGVKKGLTEKWSQFKHANKRNNANHGIPSAGWKLSVLFAIYSNLLLVNIIWTQKKTCQSPFTLSPVQIMLSASRTRTHRIRHSIIFIFY